MGEGNCGQSRQLGGSKTYMQSASQQKVDNLVPYTLVLCASNILCNQSNKISQMYLSGLRLLLLEIVLECSAAGCHTQASDSKG